jgi:hypothetical protein
MALELVSPPGPRALDPGLPPRDYRVAGAGPADVARTVSYVVSDQDTPLGEVWRGFISSPLGPALRAASTLVGVTKLGFTGKLVELDVTASLPLAEGGHPLRPR